jgi:hypothetical protein
MTRLLLRVPALRRGLLRDLAPARRQPRDGTPIDRWYSDQFLRQQAGIRTYVAGDLCGRVLEITSSAAACTPELSRRLGHNASVGDVVRIALQSFLSGPPSDDRPDAIVCGLCLQHVLDLGDAVGKLFDAVRPGGVILATIPGIGPLADDIPNWPQQWHLTPLGARRLFESAFRPQDVTTQAFGNVLTATAHLYGLRAEELRRRERELHDPDFPVLVAVRAVRPSG